MRAFGLLAVALPICFGIPHPAHAASSAIAIHSGKWSDAAIWADGTTPDVGAEVTIGPFGLTSPSILNVEVEFDRSFASLSQLEVDTWSPFGISSLFMRQPGSILAVDGQLIVGMRHSGRMTQVDGVVSASVVSIGVDKEGDGIYGLGDALFQGDPTFLAGNVSVGVLGRGDFWQLGGQATVSDSLNIGAGGTGTYRLFGPGRLSVGNVATVNGSFEQFGGSFMAGTLTIADSRGTLGSYVMRKDATLSTGRLTIGSGGSGDYTQYDGSVTATRIDVGADGGSGSYTQHAGRIVAPRMDLGLGGGSATLNMIGGTLSLGTDANPGSLRVGPDGDATVLQSGGTIELVGAGATLEIGGSPGRQANFVIEGGSLSAAIARVGLAGGSGAFIQQGGAASFGSLYLGSVSSRGLANLTGSGQLIADSVIVGGGEAVFTQSGGTASFVSLALGNEGGVGVYGLSGGSLFATTVTVAPGSQFTMSGGSFSGSVVNKGAFSFDGGSFTGSLSIESGGRLFVGAPAGEFVLAGNLTNHSTLDLGDWAPVGGRLGAAALENAGDGQFFLGGGSIIAGDVHNAGLMVLSGSFVGSASFTNDGWAPVVGELLLGNTGVNLNRHQIELQDGGRLVLAYGAALDNAGVLYLGGKQISGAGSLRNLSEGVIRNGGQIASGFVNDGRLEPGAQTLTVVPSWVNRGVVALDFPLSAVQGGAIENRGSILGRGTVAADLVNLGSVAASGGTLTLSGAVENRAGGSMSAGNGARLLLTNGLGGANGNAGTLRLDGGVIETLGMPLGNSGRIEGSGTLRVDSLNNSGIVALADGASTIHGSVTNLAGGVVTVTNGGATFTGPVLNLGQFKTTNAAVVFANAFVNAGTFISDPSTHSFVDLTVTADGVLVAGAGDVFMVSGNYVNRSQAAGWDTRLATLVFNGSGTQHVTLGNGALWGTVEVQSGVALEIDGVPGSALNAGLLKLAGGAAQLASIRSTLTIYYDPGNPGNAYLQGASFVLDGGGTVAAVPEPSVWALWLGGVLFLVPLARRRG